MSIRHPAWVFGVPSSLRLSRAAYFGRLRSAGCRRPGGRDPADLSPIKYFLARRDWGHAADYVRAMHLMVQQPVPDDYVVATGETHSVREFCDIAFREAGLNYQDYVRVDERFYRPAEVDLLIGNPSKAKAVLGWEPTYSFEQLVKEMVHEDLAALKISTLSHSAFA